MIAAILRTNPVLVSVRPGNGKVLLEIVERDYESVKLAITHVLHRLSLIIEPKWHIIDETLIDYARLMAASFSIPAITGADASDGRVTCLFTAVVRRIEFLKMDAVVTRQAAAYGRCVSLYQNLAPQAAVETDVLQKDEVARLIDDDYLRVLGGARAEGACEL